jgi:hypothetical protein
MKRTLLTLCLVGFSLLFLTGNPKVAYACGTCEGDACFYYGDIYCQNDQYTYPAEGFGCSYGLPNGCSSGSGGYDVEYIDSGPVACGDMGDGCMCPLNSTYFDIYDNAC